MPGAPSNTEFIGVKIDESNLRMVAKEAKQRAALEFGRDVAEEARIEAPEDSGLLKGKIKVYLVPGGVLVVADTDYALFVHDGTGIWQIEGRGRKTKWTYYKDGRFYTTEGQKPNRFLLRSLDRVSARWSGVS